MRNYLKLFCLLIQLIGSTAFAESCIDFLASADSNNHAPEYEITFLQNGNYRYEKVRYKEILFDKTDRSHEGNMSVGNAYAKPIRSFLTPEFLKGKRVLDVGCGENGTFVDYLRSLTFLPDSKSPR